MKAKQKLLIFSLLVSLPLFSGKDASINNEELFKTYLKQLEINEVLDGIDIKTLSSYLNKIRLTRKQLFEYYDKETRKEIREVAGYFSIPVEYLYKLFYKECRLNPYATNKISNAQGTIQFMPATARNLNTSVEKIEKMTVIEQLDFVKKYLEKINPSKKFDSFTDLYLAVFFPKAMGKPDTYVIGSHIGTSYINKVANQNKGVDKDKNNSITVSEFARYADFC